LWKLALDAALSFHWALDHRTIKLSEWQVGAPPHLASPPVLRPDLTET